MSRRLPPVETCDCTACAILAAAIDRDLEARSKGTDPTLAAEAVRLAAEAVDRKHNLDRHTTRERP